MIAVANDSGQEVDYEITEGPCLVNTHDAGEFCAEAGSYLVRFPGNKPLVLTQALFEAQFTVTE